MTPVGEETRGSREKALPMVDRDAGAAGGEPGPQGAQGPPRKIEASAARLIMTLALAGALAGLVIVLVHQWAQPRIEAHQARILQEAIYEVLADPERYETAFLVDGVFTTDPTPAADTAGMERVYVGYDEGGRPMGIAVVGEKPGFQDVIGLIFGYDPGEDEVLGMKVLESKETPGLGDKIEKDSAFVAEFAGVATPLVGVKSGAGRGADGEVDMITGATISSETIIDIINLQLAALRQPLGDLWSRELAPGAGGGTSP